MGREEECYDRGAVQMLDESSDKAEQGRNRSALDKITKQTVGCFYARFNLYALSSSH